VNAGDHKVEPREQPFILIQTALLENVDLEPVRMRNGASSAFNSATRS
jgi:hypothetical protein